MKTVQLTPSAAWEEVIVSANDWKNCPPLVLMRMYQLMYLIRRFEENLLDLSSQGLLHGPAHSSIGQEACAVGCMSVLEKQDKINGTHRMHHQFLAKLVYAFLPMDYDPTRQHELPPAVNDLVYRTLAEILGLTPGFGGGRGGSMHLKYDEAGVLGSNAIVGGNIPHAVGYALAAKLQAKSEMSVAFFGDGAMQMGTAYEAINLAALYKLPVLFFCENNQYAVSTHVAEQTQEPRLSSRGAMLGVPSMTVDGMDPVAVYHAAKRARAAILNGQGPVLIEAQTYRYYHQSGPLAGSAFGYRRKEEEEEWRKRDPLSVTESNLIKFKFLKASQLKSIQGSIDSLIDKTTKRLIDDRDPTQKKLFENLWPDPASVDFGIRGDLSELQGLDVIDHDTLDAYPKREVKYIEAVSEAARLAMARDPQIIILGEDVHRLRGGTSGATKGVGDLFPDRLLGTPICENGFTGMALGAALNGLRPIVEIMYPDFALVAADQLCNQAAKVRHMFGGNQAVPLVVRSRVSAGTGYGSQHSMDASALYAMFPGWRVVVPSTALDYMGLFNAAVMSNDPVLIVEYQSLFQEKGFVPDVDKAFIVPFGKARFLSQGSECTILTYGGMIKSCQEAIRELNIQADLIDLRTIDVLGADWESIEASLSKTNRLLIAEQTARTTAIGIQIAKYAQEKFFDYLDAPIVHVSGSMSAPVVSKILEAAALAGKREVINGLKELMR